MAVETLAIVGSIRALSTPNCDAHYQVLLNSFPKLHTLALYEVNLNAGSLSQMLQACTMLRQLKIVSFPDALPAEVALPTLIRLQLADCLPMEPLLVAIAQNCAKLEYMHIFNGQTRQIQDSHCRAILQGCPLLCDIDVEYANGISHEVRLEMVKQCHYRRLIVDWISWRNLSADTLQDVLRVCPYLTSLKCGCCAWVTDAVLQVCAQHCPLLQHADLGHCTGIPLQGIVAIALPGNQLRRLYLDGCTQITDEEVLALATARCPLLEKLILPSRKVVMFPTPEV